MCRLLRRTGEARADIEQKYNVRYGNVQQRGAGFIANSENNPNEGVLVAVRPEGGTAWGLAAVAPCGEVGQ